MGVFCYNNNNGMQWKWFTTAMKVITREVVQSREIWATKHKNVSTKNINTHSLLSNQGSAR